MKLIAIRRRRPRPRRSSTPIATPLGTNRNGSEIFALSTNGRRLRQLTETAGVVTASAEAVEVEIPEPAAQSAP
jgi:hypothetical protein